MEKRMALNNLRVSDFIHPKEQELQSGVIHSPEVKKLIEMVSDVNLKINKTKIQGTYIQLYPHTAPKAFSVLEDVCRILGHGEVPELYMCKMMSIIIQPCTAERDYIIISDYVLEQYDTDMLYFAFGNAVTMILAGHVKMTTAAAYMGCNIWTALPQSEFKKYLHAADATSDRGGLLACQSLAAAARCHFLELGISPAISRRYFTTDAEAASYIETYLSDVAKKNENSRSLAALGEWWLNTISFEGAANVMLEDLYQWYQTDYPKLLRKYTQEVN